MVFKSLKCFGITDKKIHSKATSKLRMEKVFHFSSGTIVGPLIRDPLITFSLFSAYK